MTDRDRFEQWASGPPLECDLSRLPNDPERTAWPGQYRDGNVQRHWVAWQAAQQPRTCGTCRHWDDVQRCTNVDSIADEHYKLDEDDGCLKGWAEK